MVRTKVHSPTEHLSVTGDIWPVSLFLAYLSYCSESVIKKMFIQSGFYLAFVGICYVQGTGLEIKKSMR